MFKKGGLLMKSFFLYAVFIICVFFIQDSVFALEPLRPLRTKTPPVIDGVLNDAVWKDAPRVTGFKTFSPDFGKDMSEKTVTYMAYDSENLYFAYRCFDSEPDKIKASLTTRDNIRSDDWICLNLDSFNDQQSLYAFYVNPYGIQGDSRYSNNVEDLNVDMVWYSAGKIDDEGYVIEMSIPLKSIRYSGGNPVEMAVFFERKISRKSEQASWPEFDPAQGYSMLTQLCPMIYNELEHYTLFELLPAVTYSQKYSDHQGTLTSDEKKGEVSLTAKYGITSNLILDGTYNPDFSQVEADAGQVDVNLRYNLFFAEKRPFFLEGNEIFKLGATQSSEIDPVRSLVHTRNIANPVAGVKLTGKLSKKVTVASIYAMDDLAGRTGVPGDNYAHFGIIRVKRALSDDSYLGAIYTGRELNSGYNRVAGIDGMIRTGESTTIEYDGLVSFTKNEAINSPKAEHNIGLSFGGNTRDLDYTIGLKEISENFITETGYITRNGIFSMTGLYRPKYYPRSDFFRRLDLEIFTSGTKDKFSGLWETADWVSLNTILPGNFIVKVKYSYSTEIFLGEKFKTGGGHVLVEGWMGNKLYAGILYRRIGAIYYSASPYQGRSNRVTASLTFLPSDKLSAQVDFQYADFYRDTDGQHIYDYPIERLNLSYQLNQYILFRGIVEYNNYRKEMLTDLLASFTYIPGTVFHIGYGSIYSKVKWQNNGYVESDSFLETKRGLFIKASYLWRM